MAAKKSYLGKWKQSYYLEAYLLAKDGLSDRQISEALGLNYDTFRAWKKKKPSLRKALFRARDAQFQNETTFRDYVYDRLPEHLKPTWDKIQECDENPSVIGQVESLLAENGKRGRQHLFLYALVHYSFNVTKSCRAVNIRRREFDLWITSDVEFAELVQEIHTAKKDFFESALIDLVKQGNPSAVMFANKTYNADRGYNPTKNVKVQHEGEVKHKMEQVPIDELNLTLKERKKILDSYRKIQKRKLEG